MKSKHLSILSLALLLVGCSGADTTPNTSKPSTNPSSTNKQSTNNSSTSKSTKSLFDLFESMKTGLTINGTIKDFDGDDLIKQQHSQLNSAMILITTIEKSEMKKEA